MMKKLIFPFFGLFFCCFAQAQTASKPAMSVYAEIGGPGLASVNFDTRFTKKEDGIGGRIGLGGLSIDGTSVVLIPIGINYLLSKDQKNYFEFGGGITPVIVSDGYSSDDDFTSTFGHLTFGYRYQPKVGGFLFRANIVPVFGKGFFFPYYAGVSFGYKF